MKTEKRDPIPKCNKSEKANEKGGDNCKVRKECYGVFGSVDSLRLKVR